MKAYATQARADLEAKLDAEKNLHNITGKAYAKVVEDYIKLEAENKRLREALELIEHSTAPTPDDSAYHENAYELARAALKDTK